MKHIMIGILAAMLLFGGAAGCMMTAQQGMKMEGRLGEMERRLGEVERTSEDSRRTVDNNLGQMADNLIAFENLRSDVGRLKGLYEEEKFSKDRYVGDYKNLRTYLAGEMTKIDKRLRVLEEKAGIKTTAVPVVLPASLDKVPVAKKPEKELFEEAMLAYKKKKYQSALGLFHKFLKRFPRSRQAAQAQYYIGENLFHLKKYAEALVAYDKLTSKYPKSSRAPEAAYSIALSFERLGQKYDAKLFYEKVIQEYPRSQAAKKAKKKLKLLKK